MEVEVRIDIKRTGDLSEEEKRVVEVWSQEIFGEAELAHEWAEPDWTFLVYSGGEPASHLTITDRVGLVGGVSTRMAGVGGVMTPEHWRGKGLAGKAMRRAAEFMRLELQSDFGVLLCEESLVKWYSTMGWIRVPGPALFDQPTGKEEWDQEVMVLPRARDEWPLGTIDLRGRPW
jgi:GNAT acetyltransferase-like protein